MKSLIITCVFFFILGSPVLAMEKMSNNELKETTAQIATPAGHAAEGAAPASEVNAIISNLIEGSNHSDNFTTALGPVTLAQTAAEPVRVVNIVTDANNFKSAVSFGFF